MRPKFPALMEFRHTSSDTWAYNCHAWGVDDPGHWWQPPPVSGVLLLPPGVRRYWPAGVDPSGTVASFEVAFATRGFAPCPDDSLEPLSEKIAIYAVGDRATHTARQVPSGAWTSKLGPNIDIEHRSPGLLEGPEYGQVRCFMARSRQATSVPQNGVLMRWDAATGQFTVPP